MSWLQWQGETWASTDDDAEIYVYVTAPGTPGPRTSWNLELMHMVRGAPAPGKRLGPCQRWLTVTVPELGFHDPDWRRLSGLEIRSDAQWTETAEYIGAWGQLRTPCVEVMATLRASQDGTEQDEDFSHWMAHDFTLRLGQRDGLCFPCEIDAWLRPKADDDREEPESAEELARFGEGPPNLRVVTRAIFQAGTVVMHRCGLDPLPPARRVLREHTGFTEWHSPSVRWAMKNIWNAEQMEERPGWRSDVHFHTQAQRRATG